MAGAIGFGPCRHFHRRRPLAADLARDPDADVRRAFLCAAEPRHHESAARVDNRGGMRAPKRRGLEDELGANKRRIRGWLVILRDARVENGCRNAKGNDCRPGHEHSIHGPHLRRNERTLASVVRYLSRFSTRVTKRRLYHTSR
jgi:hypothetical protein